jgi:CubicO group peptidase (beta-lactamase class C family)
MDAATKTRLDDPGACGLERAEPEAVGLNHDSLERLASIIEAHIAEGRYPGAQVAVARHGKLAFSRSFGAARLTPEKLPARDDTLWLLYSNTKIITAAAIWALVEDGALTFHDRIADHVPEFSQHGKGDITVLQVITHQAGFPSDHWLAKSWEDHELLRQRVCNFTLDWTPGSRVHYHATSAHWVLAVLIEAIAKMDFRDYIRARVIEKLGLGNELFVGVPDAHGARTAHMHEPDADGTGRHKKLDLENTDTFRRAGVPGGGGYATARAVAAFYQALLNGGEWNGTRFVSRRMIQYVTRNFTGDRVDTFSGAPMHRGLGPHSRGLTAQTRGLGSIASPATFGHGGAGSSFCWGDPESGVSFAYVSNSRVPDPWHSRRLEVVCNCVHAAIQN